MTDIPKLRSHEQILGQMADTFLALSKGRINDLNKGATVAQFLESMSRQNFKSAADIISMLDNQNKNRATGEALQRLARDANVPILVAQASTGNVDITDLSFNKISTTIYAGTPAVVAGSLVIYVTDASKFNAGGGNLYIGRGTNNVEGPLSYTSVVPISGGVYYQINLASSSPTTKFHNIGETVVFAQGGDRKIKNGSTVQTAQGSSVTSVQFTTTSDATILDGEITVQSVPVKCGLPGPSGNVPKGSIREIQGQNFQATVFNQLPFSNGRNADTDDDIRTRIDAYEQAKAKGIPEAIRVSAIDVTSPDELKTVRSANVISFANNSAALVFDDGQGYERNFVGAPFETVVDSAIGGEQDVQLRQVPITQALVKNVQLAPYGIVDGSYLAVEIQGTLTQHQFHSSEFRVPSAATPFEIQSSINGDPNINFLAGTSENGTKLIIFPRDPSVNQLQVQTPTLGVDANLILGFPMEPEYTLRLYKNDIPLKLDGQQAVVSTRLKSLWSNSIIPGDTLIYQVDQTPQVTATFQNADFQLVDSGAVVSYLTSIDTWAAVMNNLMPGVNAIVNGETIDLYSNRGSANQAKITIVGGSLLNKIFTPGQVLTASGSTPDLTLNKQTGQIHLTTKLAVGDKLTAGSQFTRASALTSSMANGPGVSGRVWMLVDGQTLSVPSGLESNSIVQFNKTGTILTISAESPLLTPIGFDNVEPGDWMLVWANPLDPAALISNQGFWRVETVQTGQITVSDGTTARSNLGINFTPLTDRIVFARSTAPMQVLDFTAMDLVSFSNFVRANILGVDADIQGSQLRISTKTFDTYGELYFLAADQGGTSLALPLAAAIDNVPSHYGFVVTQDSEAGIPSFTHSVLGTAIDDQNFQEPQYENDGGHRAEFLELLEKYTTSPRAILAESNKNRRALVRNFDPTTNQLTLNVPEYMRAGASLIQAGDRYFLRTPYTFDSLDSASLIMDGNPVTESFRLPISRRLTVNSHSTPTTGDFSADDAESQLSLNDPASFQGFDFSDFAVHRQASVILTDGTYGLKLRASDFGPLGNTFRAGFIYPTSLSQTTLTHQLGSSDVLDVLFVLPMTAPRTPNWDATTSFTVAVTTIGGMDQITYTYRVGTTPNFGNTGANVQVGDIAIVSATSGFLASDKAKVGRVSAVTAQSFTIQVPAAGAVNDNLAFSNIVNQSGTITVTAASPHNVTTGQRVGLWNTASPDGLSFPMNDTYIASVLNSLQFQVPTPLSTPGGPISTGSHTAGVVTIATVTPHNLFPGNVILISGVGSGSYDGMAVVTATPDASQFQYIRNGSSSPVANVGRFDFQSYAASGSVSLTTLVQAANLITANTVINHGLNPGDIVQIASVVVDNWSSLTTYNPGDLVRYLGVNYESLTINLNSQPSTNPSDWEVTTLDFTGTFVVNTTPTLTQFTYYYQESGNSTASGGTSTKLSPRASLARSLQGTVAENLSFGAVSTTVQQVIDYVATNLSDRILASLASGSSSATITKSTEDLGLAGNYLSGNVTELDTAKGSRDIKVLVAANIPAGSRISISGLTGGLAVYNDTYVVIQSVQSGLNYQLLLHSGTQAVATSTNSVSVPYVGSTPAVMMSDGVGSILSDNLASLIGIPQFTLKKAFVNPIAVGEELRLVALSADHLQRFWNRLIVSGVTNVGRVDYSEYGRQLQIATSTFGNSGSVQVAGGSANSQTVALVGSASQVGTKFGTLNIPYEIRRGLAIRQYLNLQNQIRQNKALGLDSSTDIQLLATGAQITGGSGSFQTLRSTTQAANTEIKIERHGKFVAFISTAGASFGLQSQGVSEGDWVRIKNINETAWSNVTSYSIGDRVNFGGFNYTSLQNSNTNNEPDTSPLFWELQEFNQANQGIFQVVRVFGDDTFWISFDNAVEEYLALGNAGNIKFYSYDSVMPGDNLVIATNIFGAQNVGRYQVVDESFGAGYSFPTSTQIWTTTIPNPPGSPVALGGEAGQFNVEEANPLSLWKRIWAFGPGSNAYATIIVDSPDLMNKFSSSAGAFLVGQGKLAFDTNIHFGIDAYRFYVGLIKQLNKVIYGSAADPINFPGVRAAGTAIDIKPANIRRITGGFSVRLKTGVPFAEVRDRIKAAIAGYINTLDVGQSASISSMITAAGSIPGVLAVAVTSPTFSSTNDTIPVGADEKALVVDPTVDLTLSVVGS